MILLNGEELNFRKFPNGETNMDGNAISIKIPNHIVFRYEEDSDLIKLMLLKKHLDHVNECACTLSILYMPYSRQDRREGNSVFTLKYIAQFINSLGFQEVSVAEPHSDVTTALLDRCTAYYPTTTLLQEVILESGFDKEKDYLFYPDAGAQKRYSSKNPGYKEIIGFKKRDFQTGRIQYLQVVGAESLVGCKVIIVDDLCSRGGTFMLSAQKLKELGATSIYLIIAHCENTILAGDIPDSPLITKVFATDSMMSFSDHPKIKIIQGGHYA